MQSRRRFLQQTGGSAIAGLGLFFRPGIARDPSYAGDHPDMLLQYLAGKLNSLASRWDGERGKIRTPEALEARNRFVRDKVREMIHGYPARSSLQPRVVRKLDREGYRVENVMFQSRPDFWVTGNLYVPTTGPGPFPALISPCGHYALARMQPDYQFAYLNLVKAGFIVLAYDPVGQGERRHYWNPHTGETELDLNPIYEHSMPGQLLLLMGQDLTHYRVWDGIRAIDYLLERSEVDPKRIGCAGHSGGGTLTMFISALDERVQCAVVNQGGTSHRWPLEIRPESPVGPSDVEQNLFPAAVHGIDLCDLHVAIAPRPLLALIEDYNPRFNEAAAHIRERYELLGVPEKFSTVEATDPHAWTVKLRQATTDWFCRWFYGRPGPEREPEFDPESPETLYCTANGSVRHSQTGDTIFSIIQKRAADLPPERPAPRSVRDVETFRRDIQAQIREVLRYRPSDPALAVRHIVTTPRKGYRIEKLEFLSEPGIYIPAWVFVPDGGGQPLPTMLYVNEAGKQADGMEFGLLERLTRRGHLIVAVDVRGIGDTRPPHNPRNTRPDGYRHLFDVETAMAYMAWYLDESLLGMRVLDVVRSVDYVLSRPDADRKRFRVVGKGAGALWTLFAAALDPRIPTVICEGGLLSYRLLTRTDRYLHGASSFARDILLRFDLPHVAAAVCDRDVTLASPVDAVRQPVDPRTAEHAYQWTRSVYAAAGAPDRFRVVGPASPTWWDPNILRL